MGWIFALSTDPCCFDGNGGGSKGAEPACKTVGLDGVELAGVTEIEDPEFWSPVRSRRLPTPMGPW